MINILIFIQDFQTNKPSTNTIGSAIKNNVLLPSVQVSCVVYLSHFDMIVVTSGFFEIVHSGTHDKLIMSCLLTAIVVLYFRQKDVREISN